jgi:hypothetical protein
VSLASERFEKASPRKVSEKASAAKADARAALVVGIECVLLDGKMIF